MGQQQVEPRRVEFEQRLVDENRVVGGVNGAQQAGEQMPEAVAGQQPDSADHRVVAAAAVTVLPVPVIRGLVTVDGNTDFDAVLIEKLAELFGQKHPVGVHLDIQAAHAANGVFEGDQNGAKTRDSTQKGLAAVQDDLDPAQFVHLGVLGDTGRRLGDNVGRNGLGTAAPTLVSALVHVAVIAREVAPAVHLEYELVRGQEHAAVHVQPSG
jgi:hypothetical protein